ncbi:MAG: glycosyltransferase family 4 protein [Chitinophagaceae bacterium]|nr:glycosyltransferase family 4 protein [Chitinophagaceae bacterium]
MQAAPKEILFIVQYPPNVSPGQRFRFELYEDLLKRNGFNVTTSPFIDEQGYPYIFRSGFFLQKLWSVLKGFFARVKLLFVVKKYNYIFLQLGVTPVGPPIFEWLLIKLLKKKIIYDFDGAIWIQQVSEKNRLPQRLRNVNKVPLICSWSYKVSCGNEFLCTYARKYNANVVYNPTCVDTENHHNIFANHHVEKVTIGWTGSFSTLKYLQVVQPVLSRLQEKYDFDIKIICNQQPSLHLRNVQYVEWSSENEVTELASCQIGLMPLTKDEWSEGKCGFKLIQYLALEIPSVSSPVGVNKKIIDNEVNGFLCDSDEEWYAAIEKLLLDAELRIRMGKAGRQKIVKEYSLLSNGDNFLAMCG